MAEEKVKISAQVAMQLVAWIVGLMLVYAATSARVAVLEDQYHRTAQDISEIRGDVKTLLQQRR